MVDLVSHVLWAYAFFHDQPEAWAYAAFSVLPDLIWAIPSVGGILTSGQAREHFKGIRKADRSERMTHIARQPHLTSCEPFTRGALLGPDGKVGAVLWAAALLYPPFFGGVFLHLAMDLFLHKESPFGQHPFFPCLSLKWTASTGATAACSSSIRLLALVCLAIYLGYW